MVVYGVVGVVCWEVQCVVYGCLYDYISMDQVVYVYKMGYKVVVMLRLMIVLLLKAVIYHKEYLPSKNTTNRLGNEGLMGVTIHAFGYCTM